MAKYKRYDYDQMVMLPISLEINYHLDKDYFSGATFVAYTNYHSEGNIKTCQKLELDAYIPDRYFRRRDPRYDPKALLAQEEKVSLRGFSP